MDTKIFGIRMSLIGDIVMSLPVLDHIKTLYPKSYIYFSIAKKCKQSKFLFENHPYIDEIKITEYDEDLGPSDYEIIKQCDVFINPKPQHPKENDWYNYRNCVEETFIMAGFDLSLLKTKPKLYLDKKMDTISNSIGIWPFAGYGKGLHRSPSIQWWDKLISKLENYKIFQFGSENDVLLPNKNIIDCRFKTFEEQIYKSLECSLIIGTDSGSMWVTGAYGIVPQINLLTNWELNHRSNYLALAPEGDKCYNFFSENSCDNINQEYVLDKMKSITI